MFGMLDVTSVLASGFGDSWWIWLIAWIVMLGLYVWNIRRASRNFFKSGGSILSEFVKDDTDDVDAEEVKTESKNLAKGVFQGFMGHLILGGGAGICFIVLIIAVLFKLFGGNG